MPLTIGKLSKATAVNVETIRYYERIGLFDPVGRGGTGHRVYAEKDVLWAELREAIRRVGGGLP